MNPEYSKPLIVIIIALKKFNGEFYRGTLKHKEQGLTVRWH